MRLVTGNCDCKSDHFDTEEISVTYYTLHQPMAKVYEMELWLVKEMAEGFIE